MSHEKCLKHVRTPCTSMAPSLVRVPVAHCFGPPGLHKRKFCAVCRKLRRLSPQAHSVCSAALAPECGFGRLRSLVLPPACVRLLPDGFSKTQSFRIVEAAEPGEGGDGADGSAAVGPGRETQATAESGKQTLKIFDGDDAVRRSQFRLITVSRLAGPEEVLEAALRAHHIPEDPGHLELCRLPPSSQACGTWAGGKTGSAVISEEGRSPGSGEATPEAWVIRALPRAQEVLKIYPNWEQVRLGPRLRVCWAGLGGRTVLMDEQPLLDRLQDIRQMSVRQVSQTRFYVAESRDVAPHVSLFVGGLPPSLSPEEYSSLLHEAVATEATVVSVSHVYSQGAVVLDVACFAEAERLYVLLKDMAVQGRLLTALVLPDLLHAKLPPDSCPLLVFVNPKSGGLKGRDLLCSFRKLLNPHQVFDLTNGGPLPGLHLFSQVPCFRVLVCGGDGTVGWVLGALEETRYRLACPEPSVAILPLGTGNDLGRVLRWGAGYSGEDPFSVLLSVDEADAVLMDRWTILLDAHEAGSAENGTADAEPPKIVQMSNYCGVIFINIPSWGSGADLWGSDSDARFEKPRMDDGLLEVVGVTGVVHMGQVQGGLRSGIRIAQGSYFRVTLLKPTPVQVDGEPWVQAPGHMIISAAGPKVHMLRKAKQKPRRAGTTRDARADAAPALEGDPR
uniref:Diacylglycerol kinase n=1 Tax=Nomascus leucogenys TaxID=61853 RepID=G1QJN8_NOMLE